MKILLCYSSNNLSNAIASAAIARYEKEDPKDFTIERFNLDKKSIRKYFNNDDIKNKANIVYVFNYDLHKKHWDTFNLLQQQFKKLKIITYSKNLIYTPPRFPGNTLKTRVHYIYDKIMYDMEVNFEQIPMYRVARSVNEIDIVHLHGFEANSPYAKSFMTEAHNCYHTKKEAREHLKKRVYKSLNIKQKEIESFEKRVEVLKSEMETLEEEYHRVSADNWTPVSERLPSGVKEVLQVTIVRKKDNYKWVQSLLWYYDCWKWWEEDEDMVDEELYRVTAWMPLPAPYKGYKDGCR